MFNKLSFQMAVKIMLILLGMTLAFHLFILTEIIPFNIVWGGRLQSVEQMRGYELIAISINLLVMLVIGIKAGYVRSRLPIKAINFLLWAFVALFAFNTIGNLMAETNLETILFTPLTLISAILCWRITREQTSE